MIKGIFQEWSNYASRALQNIESIKNLLWKKIEYIKKSHSEWIADNDYFFHNAFGGDIYIASLNPASKVTDPGTTVAPSCGSPKTWDAFKIN